MKNKKVILILVILLTIGFASVSTTLVMNGVIGIANKKEDFKVIFTSAVVNGDAGSSATIGEDKKSITFTSNKLSVVGDTAELIYKVKNNSTQYDANVTINCTGGNEEYLNIESEFAGKTLPLTEPELMRAQEVRMGRIKAELKKAYIGEDKDITITCEIEVEGEERDSIQGYKDEYTEELLNGTDPIIKENLIPVTIENDGTVKKADTTEEWYSYENKRWANAVILEDETVTYNAGETIPESNIESYFVWIPKYSYQLWNLEEYSGNESKVHTIPIKFGLTNTSDEVAGECTTPMNAEKTQGLSGESGNCRVGDYMTHPAFISMESTGLWVGKFETGYQGATSKIEAEVNTNDSSKVIIKPNVYSWRNIQISNMHLTSYNYKREMDSHMIKNTEWGAVAYLQHSAYGSATSVRINNNIDRITGYAAISEPTKGYNSYTDYESTALGIDGTKTINYKNSLSQVASTTGNYSGIYDMSGGTDELVMGVMLNKSNINPLSGENSTNNSGFNGEYSDGNSKIDGIDFPDKKYYDAYLYGKTESNHSRRILGDATGEMGPFVEDQSNSAYENFTSSWYRDRVWMIPSRWPWFRRGADPWYGVSAGIFMSDRFNGSAIDYLSFRIVLSP